MLRCVTLHCFPSSSHVLLEDRMEEEEEKQRGEGGEEEEDRMGRGSATTT